MNDLSDAEGLYIILTLTSLIRVHIYKGGDKTKVQFVGVPGRQVSYLINDHEDQLFLMITSIHRDLITEMDRAIDKSFLLENRLLEPLNSTEWKNRVVRASTESDRSARLLWTYPLASMLPKEVLYEQIDLFDLTDPEKRELYDATLAEQTILNEFPTQLIVSKQAIKALHELHHFYLLSRQIVLDEAQYQSALKRMLSRSSQLEHLEIYLLDDEASPVNFLDLHQNLTTTQSLSGITRSPLVYGFHNFSVACSRSEAIAKSLYDALGTLIEDGIAKRVSIEAFFSQLTGSAEEPAPIT